MILTTQYYRPPFPDRRWWRQDLSEIKATGLDGIYLWMCWAWVESEPESFRWDDYDDLVTAAEQAGLLVVVNLIADIQPFWIHRVLPGTEMVDSLGKRVVSAPIHYCNIGVSPGGCTDNAAVSERIAQFYIAAVERYRASPALYAWDVWNEVRWAVQADGLVCYCPATLAAYRAWLKARYGSLAGLCDAWHRRYSSWEDVAPPKKFAITYTDAVEFQTFLSWRTEQQMAIRAELVRAHDPHHLVVAHADRPAVHSQGFGHEPALSRGNDWQLAASLDGFGSSHFPVSWAPEPMSIAELGTRLEASRSAAGQKVHWVGELQGGSYRLGIGVKPAIESTMQQRWLWNAIARDAKCVNFWCWRDEVFGREAGGFGIAGSDGFARERLDALQRAAGVISANRELLSGYRPDPASVGVVFEPDGYYLDWAQRGPDNEQAAMSVLGYLLSLERRQIPYDVVEPRSRVDLDRLCALFLPWPLVVDPTFGESLAAWVHSGGVLVVESELDSFDRRGFYRYPADRSLARLLGVASLGCKPAHNGTALSFDIAGTTGAIRLEGWIEALGDPDGRESKRPLTASPVGAGAVIAVGTNAGAGYAKSPYRGFEDFSEAVARFAGATPSLRSSVADGERLQWRLGSSGDDRLLFVVSDGVEPVSFIGSAPLFGSAATVRDLASGRVYSVRSGDDRATVELGVLSDPYAILCWRP